MKIFCPHCESNQEIEKIHKREKLQVMEESVEYDADLYKCKTCHGVFATSEMEEENFARAYNIYRDKYHLLRPEKIREIRERYGLSQKDFSRFLGWGEITIHRYESGSLQDIVHNEALVLIENPHNAQKIYDMNKDRLTPQVAERLGIKIKEMIDSEQQRSRIVLDYLMLSSEYDATIESGYKIFDIEKAENLILYIAEQNKGVLKTVLNKLLWYSDFKHFKEYTVSITGLKYRHAPLGPVPKDYDLLIWKLTQEGRLEGNEVFFGQYAGEKFVNKEMADLNLFTKVEKASIDFIIKKLAHLGSNAISRRSHKEDGYKKTQSGQIIPYSFAKSLSI